MYHGLLKCINLHFSVLLYYGLQIDNVGNPSWQAQIKGTKKWTLEPPPECALVCDPKLEVTVHPGEISMLFDFVSYLFLSELKLSLTFEMWSWRITPEMVRRGIILQENNTQLHKLTLLMTCTCSFQNMAMISLFLRDILN